MQCIIQEPLLVLKIQLPLAIEISVSICLSLLTPCGQETFEFFLAKGDTAIGIYESESFSLSCLLYASTTV